MRNEFCLVKGRKVDDTECGSIIFNATDAVIALCRTCARGKALADTVGSCRVAKPANEQPVRTKTPWQMVVEATGHTSQGRLADALRTTQSKISQTFIKLGKGKLPSGPVWNDLLQLSGISAAELFAAATGKPLPQQTTPEPAASEQEMPAASEALNADLPPLSQHLLDVAELAAVPSPDVMSLRGKRIAIGAEETAGETPPTLMGADPSEQLLTSGELFAWPKVLPKDFLPYTGQRPILHGKPALHIKASGDMELSVDAVALGGLEHVGHVRPFWSDARKQIGIVPVDTTGPGVLKLQPTPSKRRRISASGFLNGFAIRPAPGTYPVERHPSGLLVATITQQPSQGGEA